MLQNPADGTHVPQLRIPTHLPETPTTPLPDHETIHHLLLGSLATVQYTIRQLHKLNYAEPNDWSRPLPTGRPNEVMAILTRRIRLE